MTDFFLGKRIQDAQPQIWETMQTLGCKEWPDGPPLTFTQNGDKLTVRVDRLALPVEITLTLP